MSLISRRPFLLIIVTAEIAKNNRKWKATILLVPSNSLTVSGDLKFYTVRVGPVLMCQEGFVRNVDLNSYLMLTKILI